MIRVNDQTLLSPDVQEWLEQLKEICRTDLFTFAKVVLNYNLLEERIHAPICAFLTDSFLDSVIYPQLINEKKKYTTISHPNSLRRRKKLLMLPRNSFKTVTASEALPLFILKECPNWSILLDSEVKDHTIDTLGKIKKHLEGNYLFRVLYGDWVGSKWDATKIIIRKRFRPDSTPSILTTGANVSTTGYHPHVIICDDLHSIENTSSSEMIDSVIEHWRELYRQLNPGGFMFIIGTPYTLTDLYAHVKQNFLNEYDIYEHSAFNEDGSLWFPERLNEKYLEEQMGKTEREMEMFNAHYRLDPSPVGEKKIDITKLKYYENLDVSDLNLYLLVDPAYSIERSACRTAIVVTGMDCDKNSYLVDYFVGRVPPDQGVAKVIDMAKKWHPVKFPLRMIGVEAESGGMAFAASVQEKLTEVGIVCGFTPLKSKGKSKALRVMKTGGLQICIAEGRFYIHKSMREFEQEANFFPKGNTMDLVDACAYHFEIATPPPKKEKRIIHDDWYKVQQFAEQQMNPTNQPQYHPIFGRRKFQ